MPRSLSTNSAGAGARQFTLRESLRAVFAPITVRWLFLAAGLRFVGGYGERANDCFASARS